MYTCMRCQNSYEHLDDIACCPGGCTSRVLCMACFDGLGGRVACYCRAPLMPGEVIRAQVDWRLCAACDGAFWRRDNAAGLVFTCPEGCAAPTTLCRDCFEGYQGIKVECPACGETPVDCEGNRADTTGKGALLGTLTPDTPGRIQRGLDCYAAALATACNWACGTRMTADEAMHAYLMDEPETGDTVGDYRKAYADAAKTAGSDSVQAVHRAMTDDAKANSALFRARHRFGYPVFPEDVPHLYLPRVSDEALRAACSRNLTVLLGDSGGMHWLVAHACEVNRAGNVCSVHYFDPATGSHLVMGWGDWASYEGYLVGRSSL